MTSPWTSCLRQCSRSARWLNLSFKSIILNERVNTSGHARANIPTEHVRGARAAEDVPDARKTAVAAGAWRGRRAAVHIIAGVCRSESCSASAGVAPAARDCALVTAAVPTRGAINTFAVHTGRELRRARMQHLQRQDAFGDFHCVFGTKRHRIHANHRQGRCNYAVPAVRQHEIGARPDLLPGREERRW